MTWGLTSPVTGAAQTGFTAPTYTHVSMIAPDGVSKQVAVSAVGGTQVGVTVHTVASPFTTNFVLPKVWKSLGKTNPTTGLLPSVPKNTLGLITRKGVVPLAGQPFSPMIIRTTIEIPAGADTADPANVRACLSMHIGALSQQSAGLGDAAIAGY